MVVNKLDNKTITLVDSIKPAIIDLHVTEMHEFIRQVPYYIKEINYIGSNNEIIEELDKQYILTSAVQLQQGGRAVNFVRPRYSVDLDITTVCNLSCANCNKLSNFNSTWRSVDLNYVKSFIDENKHRGKELLVKILGGEPALHKQVQEIIHLLYTSGFKVLILTNGVKPFTPCEPIGIENSGKETGTTPDFHTTMVAPRDLACFDGVNYSVGCTNASICGYCSKDGKYYPCATGGYINEHISKEYGIPDFGMPTIEEALAIRPEAFKTLCQYCGLFKKLGYHNIDKTQFSRTCVQEYSKSWEFFKLANDKDV